MKPKGYILLLSRIVRNLVLYAHIFDRFKKREKFQRVCDCEVFQVQYTFNLLILIRFKCASLDKKTVASLSPQNYNIKPKRSQIFRESNNNVWIKLHTSLPSAQSLSKNKLSHKNDKRAICWNS